MEERVKRLEAQSLAVEHRVQALETAKAVEEVHYGNLSNRLVSIEDTLKWLVRLIIGALVTALLYFVIAGGMNIAA